MPIALATPPLAAASEATAMLGDLLVVLVAAKLGDELFKRLRQPAVVGEILAGLLIGPSLLGLVEPSDVLTVFAEVGVILVLFWVGLETRIGDLRAVGRSAALVAGLGVALPFAGGYGLGVARGEPLETSFFFAAALVATSVGITSAVLTGLGAVGSAVGRTILGAAIVDDILAILVLAVAVGIAGGGSPDFADIGLTALAAVAFVVFVALGGSALLRRRPQLLTAPRFADSPFLPAIILCLGLAVVAGEIGLAGIIGAFLAGLIVGESRERKAVEREAAPLHVLFAPFFFASIGIQLDVGALLSGPALALLALVTVLAAATKLAGGYLGALSLGRREALAVGAGMVPRGEVGIIVAGIGAAAGVINGELFAVIVGMSVLTTLLAPPALRALLARETKEGAT